MIDLNSLKYGDPKDAVEEVYHISMESVEKFLEKVREKTLDDAFVDELRKKQEKAEYILKYNMLEIPFSVYTPLSIYLNGTIRPLFSCEWEDVLEKKYSAFLKEKNIKEAEGEECSHLDKFCEGIEEDFYSSMSNTCRTLFNTELISKGLIEKIGSFFKG